MDMQSGLALNKRQSLITFYSSRVRIMISLKLTLMCTMHKSFIFVIENDIGDLKLIYVKDLLVYFTRGNQTYVYLK